MTGFYTIVTSDIKELNDPGDILMFAYLTV